MSALVTTAATLLVLIPQAAQDAPRVSSIADRPSGIVVGEVTGVERGRLVPKRIAGWPAWSCRGRSNVRRTITCTVSAASRTFRADLRYTAARGKSTSRVVVSPIRGGR